MCDGDNDDALGVDAVYEGVRVAAHEDAAVTLVERGPALRGLGNDAERSVHLSVEPRRHRQAALAVPLRRLEEVADGPRVKNDPTCGHAGVS